MSLQKRKNSIGITTEKIEQIACPSCGAELDVSEFEVFEEITCPACEDTIKVPGQLGDYILLDELGRGAMGCVYLAQDEALGRLVGLKVMLKKYGENPEMLETLRREAQAMASLNHKNVVQVYSFGRVDEQPYIVMEFIEGKEVEKMMKDGEITEQRLLEIAMDTAEGLRAAHEAGLTHGDVKPANIFVDKEGVCKVLDFGLAKERDPNAEIEVWGTPYYIAPEKARKKGEDWRSDQYSLGATLYHVLAGHPPFDGPNPTKVVLSAIKDPTPVLKDECPEITQETSDLIYRMMDKEPARRFPTYESMQADIREALSAVDRAGEQQASDHVRALKKAKKKKMVPVFLTLLALIAGAGVGGYFVM